ncbi:hypothetical protein BUALT_Bualt13G0124000 [Buddleja alternifolia]|uniref:Nuclear pore complex protein NUP214 n=1 Tax=Buddleja alternifolia TaxID=168488 RepID=A0AAV6WU74_9LAMI|nr:hypothetical protein BUALT_Bualt13G0124000 [Buddleja alternifolia]
MASPFPQPLEFTTDGGGGARIELDEEIDGDEVGSRNYRFSKIGEPVPITPNNTSEFQPEECLLPSQPLAVSERFRLLFVAHSQGFCVARTKDVIASADQIKENQTGSSVQELSLVDVPIGKVSILALSADDSSLAAIVGHYVHFFAVSALLHKEKQPSYSISLDVSSCIKDMRWDRKVAKAYIILSANGKLYHGYGQGPLTYVMEGVDAVDWSVKGNFVAVAKKNTISLLSSQFKEKISFVLSFQSVIGDSDVNQVVKVDSIRWIRPHCIAVGCFQLNDDGEEENYVVQVITSRGRKITDRATRDDHYDIDFGRVTKIPPPPPVAQNSVPPQPVNPQPDATKIVAHPTDPLGWLARAEQQFEIHRVLHESKVQVAMVAMEGSAFNWFQWLRHRQRILLGANYLERSFHDMRIGWLVTLTGCKYFFAYCFQAASKPVVLSFNNVFMDFSSDAVPTGNGPHLFLSYLDLHGLAFVATRNLSQHVGLFSWSPDSGKNEASMVEILNDAWTLYIDSQGNGEENVILGLTVDKVSQDENVKLTLGDEETEVSPCCVILCLTIDGKVSVFHFASAAGALVSPEGTDSDEEDDAAQVPPKHELSLISSGGGDGSREATFSKSESRELSRSEFEKTGNKGTISPSSHVDARAREQAAAEKLVQRPLVNLQTVKVDEPEKSLSELSNQHSYAENQLISGVKSSSGFLSENVVDVISSQSISHYPVSSANSVPLGKVPSTISPSAWSLTRSSAGVGTSKNSDGRFLSVTSGEVDDSDRQVLQSAGVVLLHPRDPKEKAKPSATFTSIKQTASAPEGSRQSLPAYPVSQVPFRDSVASGKSFQTESRKDLNAASFPTRLPYSAQNASKQFGNVEEMARKLDNLLEDIEEKGGFRDLSITSQANFVIELEDGIWCLSDRCRMLRGLMDDQLREAQLLLDKTIQVSVRKVYMEGIFKQATDSRYWELWNRQKLSSELELKRRRILDLNQELANKLIELERHFNSLEFNKFGENGEMQRNRRVGLNWHGQSRQTQSLHSLHNTMNAQLAAAEHLSGCLSKQMAALSIGSSGKHDVKKKLFESIGLSYVGDSQIPLGGDRTCVTPPNKEHLITSSSVATKEHSRRNQTSFAKTYEPETARRLRDSLNRSWASFEPPKTTVKRIIKEDNEKGSANRSLITMDKQYLSPQSQKKSEVAHSALLNISGASLNNDKSKGTAVIPVKQFMEGPSTAGHLDRGIRVSSTRSFFSSPPSSISEIRMTQNSELEAFKLTNEKSKSTLPFTGNNDFFASSDSKFVQQSVASFRPLPSRSTWLPEQSLESPSDSIEILDRSKTGITMSTTLDQKNPWLVSQTPLLDSSVTPASAFSSGPNVSEKGLLFTKSSEKPSRIHDHVSASTPLQSAFGSSLFSNNTSLSLSSFDSEPCSPTLFPPTPSGSGASVVAKQEVSQPQASVLTTLNFSSSLPSSTPESDLSAISTSSAIVKSEPLTSSSNPPFMMYGSKTEGISQTSVPNTLSKLEKDVKIQASATQPRLAIYESDLKLGPSVSSASTELPTNSKSGSQSQIELEGSSKSSAIITSIMKSEQTYPIVAPSPIAVSSDEIVGSVKTIVSDTSHEEEMEEEAPETNQTIENALGNLGGFGIGSTANSSTPKSNPFGVAVLDKDTTSVTSQFTISPPSGELFRPASFNFQSPQPPQPTAAVNFSGGFCSGNPGQVSPVSGFGQPAHVGAGQQALGSVLGSFGQSRQLGAGLPGSNVASASGFGGGFMGRSAGGFGGGFTSASTGGGFSSLAAGNGGFAAAATTGSGFAAAATAGGGFGAAATVGGGFAAAAASVGGGFASSATVGPASGGFGGFGNQQGAGGFSAFGSGSGNGRPPSQLFTQMRK